MRQTTGSILCPGCGKLIDVDEERCPYCGRWQPGMFGYSSTIQRFAASVDVTAAISAYCILLYVASLVIDIRGALSPGGGMLGILSPSTRALYLLGMTSKALMEGGHWYTMLSATFLHGGLIHIFFNVLWIRGLGPTVEDAFGPARYFIIFMAGGIGGFLLSNLFSPHPTVGASGAIFGLLAATVAYGRSHGGSFGAALTQRALMWAGLLLVFGFMSARTNNLAHIGGFVFGYFAALLFLPSAEKREGPVLQLGALVLAGGSVVALVASLITIGSYLLRG
jgi:rhomboid protease GluP